MTYTPLDKLIDFEQEVFRVVRQQIAAIIRMELDNQTALGSSIPETRVLQERAIQWAVQAREDARNRVNVWFESKDRDEQGSANTFSGQYEMRYNIDCIAFATQAEDETVSVDENAADKSQRLASFVEQVFSSQPSVKLGLPPNVVANRTVLTLRTFQPQQDNAGGYHSFVTRVQLKVRAVQPAKQNDLNPLEGFLIQLKQAPDGSVILAEVST